LLKRAAPAKDLRKCQKVKAPFAKLTACKGRFFYGCEEKMGAAALLIMPEQSKVQGQEKPDSNNAQGRKSWVGLPWAIIFRAFSRVSTIAFSGIIKTILLLLHN
jgi:hypothetical protein